MSDFEIRDGVLIKYTGHGGSVVIPRGVTEIGANAFKNCQRLVSVSMPDGITTIGDLAFGGCVNLVSVDLPNGVKTLGRSVFVACDKLDSITVPESVEEIGSLSLDAARAVICRENSAAHRYCEEHYIPFLFDYQYAAFHGADPGKLEKLASPFLADEEQPYLFVSYSHKDRKTVLPILKSLYESGWRIWFDEGLTIGDKYDEVLEKHVADCSAFLLFASRNSRSSRYVRQFEIPWAKRYEKPIVRCVLQKGVKYEIPGAEPVASVTPDELGAALETVAGLEKGAAREAKGITVTVDPSARSIGGSGGFAYCLYSEKSASAARTILRDVKDGGAVVYDPAMEGVGAGPSGSSCIIAFLDNAFLADPDLMDTLSGAYKSGRDIAVCLLEPVSLPEELGEFIKIQALNYAQKSPDDMNKKLLRYLEKKGCRNVSAIPGFMYEKTEDGITVTRYTARDPHPRLENEYGGVPVTKIAGGAFRNCRFITDLKIPDGVTEIGESAFLGCSGLTEAVIPDGVTRIESGTFHGCGSLANVVIPAGVTEIEDGAFDGCGLTAIVIPEGVTAIGMGAFQGCAALRTPVLPEKLTVLGLGAFSGCRSFDSITVPNGIKEIRAYTFYGCDGLISAVLPDSTESIGEEAFCYCEKLTSVTLPDGVTEIGERAFFDCKSLRSLVIPDSVKEIGHDAFSACDLLTVICSRGSYAEDHCKRWGIRMTYPADAPAEQPKKKRFPFWKRS